MVWLYYDIIYYVILALVIEFEAHIVPYVTPLEKSQSLLENIELGNFELHHQVNISPSHGGYHTLPLQEISQFNTIF